MRKKLLIYAVFPILALAIFGADSASAHGLFGSLGNAAPEQIAAQQQTLFQKQAEILGISIDEFKNAWAEGKSLKEIAEEKGISQEQLRSRLKTAALEQLKLRLQTLVDQAVISQAQADKRFQAVQNKIENLGGKLKMFGLGRHFLGTPLVNQD